MVLEKLYSIDFLKKNKQVIFLISLACTIMGIGWSLLLFKGENSFVSLAFISLILLYTLKEIIQIHLPNTLKDEKKTAISDYKSSMLVFIYIFMGIFIPFLFYSIVLPENATKMFFNEQQKFIDVENINEITATSLFSNLDLYSVFLNNFLVFIACFISAFLFGMGAIFLFIVVWNASVFGVVFGIIINHSATNLSSVFVVTAAILLAAFPHMLIEIISYFIAGATGERISDWLFFKGLNKKIFMNELKIAIVSIVIGLLGIVVGCIIEISYAPFILTLFL